MLSKQDLLALLVGLAANDDTSLADEDRCLPDEVCTATDRAVVREAAQALARLLKDFSYTRSAEMARAIHGKSPAVAAMLKRQAADPVKQAHHRSRFQSALTLLLSSDAAYDLVQPKDQAELDRIKGIMTGMANPDHRSDGIQGG